MTIYRLMKAWPDVDTQRKADWVALMMSASESTAARIPVTPQAIVAQAALESGWGAVKVGNCGLFGVKADPSWKGARVLTRTREYIAGQWVVIDDWFRDYPSYQACVEDHFAFLEENGIYRAAGVFDGKGDDAYFRALAKAGYATDPHYAATLSAVEQTLQDYFLKYMEPIGGDQVAMPRRVLIVGCTGADVAALQRRLNIEADSSFGPKTLAAVIDWQAVHGLAADGVVGPKTRQAMGL